MNEYQFGLFDSQSTPASAPAVHPTAEPALDTRSLRYFVVLAEERHFGRAAHRLRIAQPALSRHLKTLESALKISLLTRTTRRVELTPAGEILLARGRRILSEIHNTEDELQRIGTGHTGHIRLGFTGSATYGIMPTVVRETRTALPDITCSIRGEMHTPALTHDLVERRLDIALLRTSTHSPDLTIEQLTLESIIAAVPATSELASAPEELTMAQLSETTLIGYPPASSVGRKISAKLAKQVNYATKVPETSTMLTLVAAGLGVALVPASSRALQLPGVVFRSIAKAPVVELALAWRADNPNPSLHRVLPLLRQAVQNNAALFH